MIWISTFLNRFNDGWVPFFVSSFYVDRRFHFFDPIATGLWPWAIHTRISQTVHWNLKSNLNGIDWFTFESEYKYSRWQQIEYLKATTNTKCTSYSNATKLARINQTAFNRNVDSTWWKFYFMKMYHAMQVARETTEHSPSPCLPRSHWCRTSIKTCI